MMEPQCLLLLNIDMRYLVNEIADVVGVGDVESRRDGLWLYALGLWRQYVDLLLLIDPASPIFWL